MRAHIGNRVSSKHCFHADSADAMRQEHYRCADFVLSVFGLSSTSRSVVTRSLLAAEPQVTATPTQPPPSVPTPLSSTNPGDVKTVSAGTGPLVAPPVEQPPQKTPEGKRFDFFDTHAYNFSYFSSLVSSQKTASDVTPTNEAPTSIATSTAEAAGAAVSSESS